MAQAYANNAGALIVPLTLAELAALLRCVECMTDDLGTVDHVDDKAAELALLQSAARIMAETLKQAEAGGVGDAPAPTDAELRRQLAERFRGRAAAQGWKPGRATYSRNALEFFISARATLELVGRGDAIPEILLTLVSVGRDPVELLTGKREG
jgi:hypothetical protein